MARGRRTGNRRFPKRSTLWIPFEVTLALTTAGTVVNSGDLLANYFGQTGEEVPIGSTVGPVRWLETVTLTTLSSNDPAWRAEEVMQLNKEGGRATIPSPGVDILDALWYGQIWNGAQLLEAAAGVFQSGATAVYRMTKAKRKITGNGQVLIISAIPSSNSDMTMTHIGVVMLMLP